MLFLTEVSSRFPFKEHLQLSLTLNMLLNLPTSPHFSLSLSHTEDESSSALISRILRKSGLDKQAQETLKSASSSSGQSSGSLQYEYEGGRWLLSDGKPRIMVQVTRSRLPNKSILHLSNNASTTHKQTTT